MAAAFGVYQIKENENNRKQGHGNKSDGGIIQGVKR